MGTGSLGKSWVHLAHRPLFLIAQPGHPAEIQRIKNFYLSSPCRLSPYCLSGTHPGNSKRLPGSRRSLFRPLSWTILRQMSGHLSQVKISMLPVESPGNPPVCRRNHLPLASPVAGSRHSPKSKISRLTSPYPFPKKRFSQTRRQSLLHLHRFPSRQYLSFRWNYPKATRCKLRFALLRSY